MHRTKTKGYKKPGECIEPRLRVIKKTQENA